MESSKHRKKTIPLSLLALTAACATVEQKPQIGPVTAYPETTVAKPAPSPAKTPFPRLKTNGHQELILVRMMEGGGCKNELEGARGEFLVYVNREDIKRIKADKGSGVFSEYDKQIQDFSLETFVEILRETRFIGNPFSSDNSDAAKQLAGELADKFEAKIKARQKQFEQETGLRVDIDPLRTSFEVSMDGCEIQRT